ncbi:MAG: SDR family NAD(P)-dependent oxidoreductase [Desulfobacterales bacterium]|nr:SDR family NAD(P)-dependent oxidoreductase [Desulfobacterales bacterium]
MALNLDAVGEKIGPVTTAYSWKDVVLYALGVGAGFDELNYVYEKDLKVIPSFGIAAIFEFLSHFGIKANVNLAGILHGEQQLIFHNPIPTEGKLITEGEITNIYDIGADKGALIVGKSQTYHENGKRLFTSVLKLFSRLDGGFGGEPAPKTESPIPDREPDYEVEDQPSPDQPLLYRLSGDVFQLHVDPEFAKMAGFDHPIMHGLCTHGFACRALIGKLIPGEPERMHRFDCRFSKALYPGDPIKTQIWELEAGRAAWQTVNAKTGEPVITNGIFEYGEIPKDEIRFDGQVAIVTGAGGGLGKAYALDLAARGAKVVVNDLGGARDGSGEGSATPAQKVVDEIKAGGGEAVANYDNVATPEGGENIVQTALDNYGTVDILINNAGILRDKSFAKMEPETWQAVIDVHLNGAYNVTRPAFRVMREKGYGRIIMTTSAAGLYGNFGQANYSAAKMGLVGFMNTLKLEGKKYNIRVNTVAPLAASRLTEDVLPAELLDKVKPEFVSPLVLYLCSERCPVSGRIYNAGMGCFNRAAVVTGPGAVLGQADALPGAEQVAANLDKIKSLKNGKEYNELNEQVMDVMNAFAAQPQAGGEEQDAGGYTDPAAVFAAMPRAFNADAAKGVDVVFQYHISGESGGDWYCIVADGTCTVEPGTHEKPTCTLKMEDRDFLAMINGELPAMQAYTSGKLKIGGDVMKSQLIEKLFRL